jgi:hypothetical protein
LKKFLFFFRKEKSTRRRFLFALSCRPTFQRLGVANLAAWLTLIYRTTGLRAVEDFVVVGLTDSLGVTTCCRLCPASLGCDNIIPQGKKEVNSFFGIFSKKVAQRSVEE